MKSRRHFVSESSNGKRNSFLCSFLMEAGEKEDEGGGGTTIGTRTHNASSIFVYLRQVEPRKEVDVEASAGTDPKFFGKKKQGINRDSVLHIDEFFSVVKI